MTPGRRRCRPHQHQLGPVAAPAQSGHPEGIGRRQDQGRLRPGRRRTSPGDRGQRRQRGPELRARRGLPGRPEQDLSAVELRVRAGLLEGGDAVRVAVPVWPLPGLGRGPGTSLCKRVREREKMIFVFVPLFVLVFPSSSLLLFASPLFSPSRHSPLLPSTHCLFHIRKLKTTQQSRSGRPAPRCRQRTPPTLSRARRSRSPSSSRARDSKASSRSAMTATQNLVTAARPPCLRGRS